MFDACVGQTYLLGMARSPQQNTRQHARARVDLYVNKVTGDTQHVARVRDLSVGGMYMTKLLEPESEQMEFNVEMQIPGKDEVIWAGVKVVRREEHADQSVGYGVRFSRLSEADRKAINEYVQQQPFEVTSSTERSN